MRWAIGLCGVLWAGFGAAWAQQFEVASVKPSRAVENMAEGQIRAMDLMREMLPEGTIPLKGATVAAHTMTLAQLAALAHKIKPSAVTGPQWIHELRYDVDAKLPERAAAKDANAMLRHLLEERFALKTHSETKATGGYALVAAKDGPKLAPAAPLPQTPPDPEEMQRRTQERQEQARRRLEELSKTGGLRGYTSWRSTHATGAQIAESVARIIKAPVTDETGLTGKYDVSMELLPGEPDDTVEYRMSLALAKLGLKLESRKTEVTTLVVDSASRTPAEN